MESEPRGGAAKAVALDALTLNPEFQLRDRLEQWKVEEYAAVFDRLPPVLAARIGGELLLLDGFHRVAAARLLGRAMIDARIVYVDADHAFELTVQANAGHGLPLKTKEKKAAARGLLRRFPGRSDRWIAEDAGLSGKTVTELRRTLESGAEIPHVSHTEGRDGKHYACLCAECVPVPVPEEEGTPRAEPAILDWPPDEAGEFSPADGCIAHAVPSGLPPAVMPADAPAAAELIPFMGFGAPGAEFTGRAPGDAALPAAADVPGAREHDATPGARACDETREVAAARGMAGARAGGAGEPIRTGPVEIYHADARCLAEFVGREVHLVVTSPPYNVGIAYGVHDDNLPEAEYAALLAETFAACHAVMADGARIAVVVPFGTGRNPWVPFAPRAAGLLAAAGFTLRGQIVWDKGTSGGRTTWGSFRLPTDPCLRDRTEAIVVAHKGAGRLPLPDGLARHDSEGPHSPLLAGQELFTELAQDYWRVPPESAARTPGTGRHPAPFPEALVERLIRFYAYPGAHVLDPFAGSGTVGAVALRLGLSATLIDVDPAYCRLAAERCARIGAAQRA